MPDTCKLQLAISSFISCFFKSAFASADLIFYNFLEPHSAFSAKNIDYMKKKLSQIFMFNEFIQTSPTPLTTKIY